MRVIILLSLLLLASCKSSPDCDEIIVNLEENFNSGNFSKVRELSDSLKKVCSDQVKVHKGDSLEQIAERISNDFSVTAEQLAAQLQEKKVSYTPEELASWERKGWIEGRIIEGQKMYFRRTASNLLLLKKFHEDKEQWTRENSADPELNFRLNHTTVVCKSEDPSQPSVPVKMKVSYTIKVDPDVVPDGEKIRCWMPWPKSGTPRQTGIRLLSTSQNEYIIAPDTAIHSSIYMEGIARKGVSSAFNVTFVYESRAQHFKYKDIIAKPYNRNSTDYTRYTAEQSPQIRFTEAVKHLADSIVAGEEKPDQIVRKIYLWFKENVPWTGALEYSIMPNIPEYVCTNMRGDCGMQTFLFMSMLRYKGIPVRWQSGWMVPPDAENLHDWCEVYYEGTGWVPADVSYNLQQSDDQNIKEYYLSGIDSYRMIVNEGISGILHPMKNHLRSEPYDFQRGEVEWEGGNLYFDKWDYDIEIEYLQ